MIDGDLLREMLNGGFANLSYNADYLNRINIFPVSDDDTGTNMKKTLGSGSVALSAEISFSDTLSSFVKGMLIGSRGNSGFILSQYFLGVYEYTKGKNTVSVAELCSALQNGFQVAYKAVLHPVEGTILTIMREGIKMVLPRIGLETSVKEFFDILVEEMYTCMLETRRQMGILNDNSVLDSGAVGLYLIFDGMKRVLYNDSQYFDCEQNESFPNRGEDLIKAVSFFRYCTEFVLTMRKPEAKEYFVPLLANRGDSIVIAAEESILKVHIHTNEPQDILHEFAKYGDMVTTKIDDNFDTQEFAKLKKRKHNGFAVVAFTYAESTAKILEDTGADVAFCIPFGHDPSEQGLKKLLAEFFKENLILFATDKEIYKKLKSIQWNSNLKNLYIAESESIVKTFFMLSLLIFSEGFKNIVKSLERLKERKLLEINIKATVANNHMQYSGNSGGKSISTNNFAQLLESAVGLKALEPYSTVVVFEGKNCDPSDAEALRVHLEKNNDVEFSFFDGRQCDYSFIIGAF
jgi:DAK2 domain fusion protein YloV